VRFLRKRRERRALRRNRHHPRATGLRREHAHRGGKADQHKERSRCARHPVIIVETSGLDAEPASRPALALDARWQWRSGHPARRGRKCVSLLPGLAASLKIETPGPAARIRASGLVGVPRQAAADARRMRLVTLFSSSGVNGLGT